MKKIFLLVSLLYLVTFSFAKPIPKVFTASDATYVIGSNDFPGDTSISISSGETTSDMNEINTDLNSIAGWWDKIAHGLVMPDPNLRFSLSNTNAKLGLNISLESSSGIVVPRDEVATNYHVSDTFFMITVDHNDPAYDNFAWLGTQTSFYTYVVARDKYNNKMGWSYDRVKVTEYQYSSYSKFRFEYWYETQTPHNDKATNIQIKFEYCPIGFSLTDTQYNNGARITYKGFFNGGYAAYSWMNGGRSCEW
jgi:hypothetical protein